MTNKLKELASLIRDKVAKDEEIKQATCANVVKAASALELLMRKIKDSNG